MEEIDTEADRNEIETKENDIEYDEFVWSQTEKLSDGLGNIKWIGGGLQTAFETVKLAK